ncbi:MAG TPA: metal ABC transporter substrate-binding protein [Candidatus Tumulicola sp.]
MPLKRYLGRAAVLIAAACLASCAGRSSAGSPGHAGPIQVVTTISTLESFVHAVGGDRVRVSSIVPIGASPETFEPTPQDVATLSRAQLLVENGAGLETWLDRLLASAGSQVHVVVCTDGLPIKNANPHLWMDPQLAKRYVLKIRDGLVALDPRDAALFRKNATAYNARLDKLTSKIQAQIDTLPPSHRYMIVFHNAWQYYNGRFGITTLGFVEPNPGQEPNPQQIAQLVDLAKQHGVRAVFSEPEYSPKLLVTIAQGAGVKVVQDLYDDSLGTKARVAEYIPMLEYDTDIIVEGLR